ncbi:MAG TPA: serine acetyltransferase [Solirubrobacteraceae bacterium]|nr:serine acetyltransferase [Solirubrobacteraceae bacterium]
MLRRLRLYAHLPLLLAVRACSFTRTATRDALRARDLHPAERGVRVRPRTSGERALLLLEALAMPEVRSVLYHRLGQGTMRDQLMCILLKRLYAGQHGVEIRCADIGPGFALGHGQGAVVWAERIGRDCTIYQQVTVGLSDGTLRSLPVLGDRVWLWPGARVIGASVGADATVGANAVVLDDVPVGATAVGIPARVLGDGGS